MWGKIYPELGVALGADFFKALVDLLSLEGCLYSILVDPIIECPSAISCHDPTLISSTPEKCVVFTSNVTFGLFDLFYGRHSMTERPKITFDVKTTHSSGLVDVNVKLLKGTP